MMITYAYSMLLEVQFCYPESIKMIQHFNHLDFNNNVYRVKKSTSTQIMRETSKHINTQKEITKEAPTLSCMPREKSYG